MSRITRLIIVAISVFMVSAPRPTGAEAQHRAGRRPSPPARHTTVAVRGEFIFVGGYFYDPFFGSLDLRVQPADAAVTIDGQAWVTSEEGYFMIQVADGSHRVEVSKQGYRRFSTEITVGEGKTTPLNVSLSPEKQ